VEIRQFNDAPKGTILGTVPVGGTGVAKGADVQVLVSRGEPDVAFSDGKNIRRINAATETPLPGEPTGAQADSHPTFDATGDRMAYIAGGPDGGQVMVLNLAKKKATATAITPANDHYTSLDWAPTAGVDVLAMAKLTDTDFTVTGFAPSKNEQLCLGQVTRNTALLPKCFPAATGFALQRVVHWYPNGTAILAEAIRPDGSFGMVRWKLRSGRKAFSTDPADYGTPRFVTDVSQPGRGAIDAALSPDSKKLAVVANFGTSGFRLWIANDPSDFQLTGVRPTPLPACKLAWRGDSQQLLVTQGSPDCITTHGLGALQRVDLSNPRFSKTLSAAADDPAYQPGAPGG
jgi:hypothetical protein